MRTKVEGILIRKTPYQDRHLIGDLLLRSGRKVAIIFYGGQGGGKKQKSTVLELGHLIRCELGHSRSTQQLQSAKEWKANWVHQNIRLNHQAFYLMCAYSEIIQKLVQEESLHDQNQRFDQGEEGLFKVLSNGLYFLDERCGSETFDPKSEFIIFLGKLLIELGVFPVRESCVFCEIPLKDVNDVHLMADQGGFSCGDCFVKVGEEVRPSRRYSHGRELWEVLGVVANQRYKDLSFLKCEDRAIVEQLFHFFCYQFQFHQSDFKAISTII